MDAVVNIGLWSGYVLIVASSLLAIVMPLLNAIGEPQKLIKAGLGLVALLVLFLIGYLLADDTAVGAASSGTSQFVGGALILMYLLALGAIGGIVYTELSKLFK